MRLFRRASYLISRNKTIQKLSYSKTYMFYTLKMMYYKFGWLIKLAKNILLDDVVARSIFKGVYSDYTWLKKEYIAKYSNQKKYSELSPKQLRGIIDNITMIFMMIIQKTPL